MNAIRQHIPASVVGFEEDAVTIEFDTLEELVAIPFVKNFSIYGNFYRYSVSDNHLMAEYRGGREWWVIGFLQNPDIGLPAWDHGYYEVEIDGEPNLIRGTDVSWSCGDDVGLRDGRRVKRRRSD